MPVWHGTAALSILPDRRRRPAEATSIDDLAGDIHAFSDPGFQLRLSWSTAAELAAKGVKPERFFRQIFFTYGHATSCGRWPPASRRAAASTAMSTRSCARSSPTLTERDRAWSAPSHWFGFPPIACPLAGRWHGRTARTAARPPAHAHEDDRGPASCSRRLRLDAFADEPPSLFDADRGEHGSGPGSADETARPPRARMCRSPSRCRSSSCC